MPEDGKPEDDYGVDKNAETASSDSYAVVPDEAEGGYPVDGKAKTISSDAYRAAEGVSDEEAAGLAEAQRMVEEAEYGGRQHGRFMGWTIAIIAGGWSLFQLYLPAPFLPLLDDTYARAIHLAFALLLVYLCFPQFRPTSWIGRLLGKTGPIGRPLIQRAGLPWLDILLGCVAAGCALYLMIDYEGIASRQGSPLWRDLLLGWGLIGFLLAATWRALGPALPVVAGCFILLAFFGATIFITWLDTDWWMVPPSSERKFINQMTMSTEGIYGIPLMVSTNVVFLYVLLGSMLDRAGGGKWFTDLAFATVGRFRGGPGKAAVLASGMTGMVSGSSIANTVTTGTFTIPMMKKAGYPAEKAGAIEVASSTNGQLMPPIMGAAAFIIANYCNMDYFEVVKHAFVPAVISYIALIWITHLEAGKLGLKPVDKSLLPPFWVTFLRGAHFLLPIGMLVVELVVLRHSPQLAALNAIGVLALVTLVAAIIRTMRFNAGTFGKGVVNGIQDLLAGLVAGGKNMMGIGVAVAAAGIIAGVVNMGIGGMITEQVAEIAGDHFILLLIITAVASLILGMGLPTTANYIVMATLTVPVIVQVAPEGTPLIAAHLFCFYFGILADDTPPVGLAAYAASAISRGDPIRTGLQGFMYDMRTAILPFMFIFNSSLLLIGVDTWGHAIMVFTTALVAMFAFASLTQNWFFRKNRLWEMGLLLASVVFLLRPDAFTEWWGVGTWLPWTIGLGAFAGTAALQLIDRGTARAAVSPAA